MVGSTATQSESFPCRHLGPVRVDTDTECDVPMQLRRAKSVPSSLPTFSSQRRHLFDLD